MALYRVVRTDEVQPGEFVDAFVTAGGSMQARKAVAHMNGGSVANLKAVKVDTTADIRVLSVYWDEREPLAPMLPEDDDPSWGDSDFIGKTL